MKHFLPSILLSFSLAAVAFAADDATDIGGGGIWIKGKPGQDMPKEAKAVIIEYGTYGDLQETGISEDGLLRHVFKG